MKGSYLLSSYKSSKFQGCFDFHMIPPGAEVHSYLFIYLFIVENEMEASFDTLIFNRFIFK